MFDAHSYRGMEPGHESGGMPSDELSRRCREPSEAWALARRASRPSASRLALPRVAMT